MAKKKKTFVTSGVGASLGGALTGLLSMNLPLIKSVVLILMIAITVGILQAHQLPKSQHQEAAACHPKAFNCASN
jgi:hydrogenase/urease accessory protein HupE